MTTMINDIALSIEEKESYGVQIDISPQKTTRFKNVSFILMNEAKPPSVIEDGYFYVNNDYSTEKLNLQNPGALSRAIIWSKRFRNIIDKRGIFRCEDLDMMRWNTTIFKNKYVSGSTYVSDGNLNLFEEAISELENNLFNFII